jgi:hypothetical protein
MKLSVPEAEDNTGAVTICGDCRSVGSVTITCALRAVRAFLLELFFLAEAPTGNVKSKTIADITTSDIRTDLSIFNFSFATSNDPSRCLGVSREVRL